MQAERRGAAGVKKKILFLSVFVVAGCSEPSTVQEALWQSTTSQDETRNPVVSNVYLDYLSWKSHYRAFDYAVVMLATGSSSGTPIFSQRFDYIAAEHMTISNGREIWVEDDDREIWVEDDDPLLFRRVMLPSYVAVRYHQWARNEVNLRFAALETQSLDGIVIKDPDGTEIALSVDVQANEILSHSLVCNGNDNVIERYIPFLRNGEQRKFRYHLEYRCTASNIRPGRCTGRG